MSGRDEVVSSIFSTTGEIRYQTEHRYGKMMKAGIGALIPRAKCSLISLAFGQRLRIRCSYVYLFCKVFSLNRVDFTGMDQGQESHRTVCWIDFSR